MGREIRRIPPGWQHPRDEHGNYIPLFDQAYSAALADYEYAARLWDEGQHPAQADWPLETNGVRYSQWVGDPPAPAYYRVEAWTEDDATSWCLYETVTEGTPVSPAFTELDDLLEWMLCNGYSPDEVSEVRRVGWLPTMRGYRLESEAANGGI